MLELTEKQCLHIVYLIFLSSERPKETGFHQSTRICLEKIREAMLHHRWQEAAEYIACYPQMLEDATRGSARQYKEVGLFLLFILCHIDSDQLMQIYRCKTKHINYYA